MSLLGNISNANLGLITGLLSGGGHGSFGSAVSRGLSGYASGRQADFTNEQTKKKTDLLGQKTQLGIKLTKAQLKEVKERGEQKAAARELLQKQADQFQSGMILSGGNMAEALAGVEGLSPKEQIEMSSKIASMTPDATALMNKDVIPDGKGGFMPNPHKIELAKAKRPVNTLTNSPTIVTGDGSPTDKKFFDGLGGLGNDVVAESRKIADASRGQINTIHSIRDAQSRGMLEGLTGKPNLWWLRIADSLGMAGENEQETLRQTQKAIQAAAQLQLDAAKQMKGQGQITENERKLIAMAGSPKIFEMTPVEITQFLDALEKVARYNIKNHNDLLQTLPKDKVGHVTPLLGITAPDPYQPGQPQPLLGSPAAAGVTPTVPAANVDSIVNELLR